MAEQKNSPPALFCSLYATIPEDKIVTLKYLLEGYEGLATLSTIEYETSLVILKYFPGSRQELLSLLESSHDMISHTHKTNTQP